MIVYWLPYCVPQPQVDPTELVEYKSCLTRLRLVDVGARASRAVDIGKGLAGTDSAPTDWTKVDEGSNTNVHTPKLVGEPSVIAPPWRFRASSGTKNQAMPDHQSVEQYSTMNTSRLYLDHVAGADGRGSHRDINRILVIEVQRAAA